jgi:hypothetical protein
MDWIVDVGRGEDGRDKHIDWRLRSWVDVLGRDHRGMRYPFALVLDWILFFSVSMHVFLFVLLLWLCERDEERRRLEWYMLE